jgi:hypothetical protein
MLTRIVRNLSLPMADDTQIPLSSLIPRLELGDVVFVRVLPRPFRKVAEATGIPVGQVETFAALLRPRPNTSLYYWKIWYFGRIPWTRETVSPASSLISPQLKMVFNGFAILTGALFELGAGAEFMLDGGWNRSHPPCTSCGAAQTKSRLVLLLTSGGRGLDRRRRRTRRRGRPFRR